MVKVDIPTGEKLTAELLEKARDAKGVLRGETVNVYKPHHGDCSNNGLSSRFDTMFIFCPEGHLTAQDAKRRGLPILKCEIRIIAGRPYRTAVEADADGNFKKGWAMMGGTFIYTPDSRFREHISETPIALHDRYE